jgi:ssDNA thymidine ADP-ribosyltransferase, DarT
VLFVEQMIGRKGGGGTLKRRLAYHFTHVSNLAEIVNDGELRSDSLVSSSGSLSVEVGDPAVKAKRRKFVVPVLPGGVLADYVPFYFAPRSPMLLRAASGRVPGFVGKQDELVFVVVDLDSLIAAGYSLVVTDGHPVARLTQFLPDRLSVETAVDWDLMDEQIWADTEADGDRLRRRQAELLVRDRVRLTEVLGFAVRTVSSQAAVVALLGGSLSTALPVLVRPGFYYEGKP